MSALFDHVVETFWNVLFSALALPYGLASSKGREWFRLQRSNWSLPPSQNVDWIHASSLGELEMAATLIQWRIHESPEEKKRILLTFNSPSAAEKARTYADRLGISIAHLPLTYFNPNRAKLLSLPLRRFVAVKYDLYPQILRNLGRRNIPVGIVNVDRVSSTLRRILHRVQLISCVRQECVDFVRSANPHLRVSLDGDLKWESAFYRRQTSDPVRSTLVLGSVWPDDLTVLLPALCQSRWKNIIVVPHEPHSFPWLRLKTQIQGYNPRTDIIEKVPTRADLSLETLETTQMRFIFVNRVGVLMDLYGLASAAYVGGGFHHRIHNVFEPLAYGIPVLTGPRTQATPEVEDLNRQGLVQVIRDRQDCTSLLDRLHEVNLLDHQSLKQMFGSIGASRNMWKSLAEMNRAAPLREGSPIGH